MEDRGNLTTLFESDYYFILARVSRDSLIISEASSLFTGGL